MTTLFLLFLSILSQSDSLEAEERLLDFGLLFYSEASADLNAGLKTLSADTLSVYPRGSFSNNWVSLSAETAVEYSSDSTFSAVEPLSAEAYFRWPGSPWLATGVSMGVVEPFLPGFDVPVREWKYYSVMDSTVVTFEAGGLLGFQGFWNQFGDSLSWYRAKSPWLGFGTVSWNGIRENSDQLETVSGFLDLRKVQPWFLFVKENSQWAYHAEFRDMKLLKNRLFSVEAVPRFCFQGDTVQVGLTGYLRGEKRALSAMLSAVTDVTGGSESSVSAGADLLSQVGIEWSLRAHLENMEDFSGKLSGFYRMSPAGCGAALEIFDDSLRITTTALYSPVAGISAELSFMSNLNPDSPEPACLLRIFGARDDVTAGFEVEWGEGSTTLGMEVSAWID